MAIQIEGSSTVGDGGVKRVGVTNKGRLNTLAATVTDTLASTLEGNAFNLNTGEITGLSTADSAILYYKHNEPLPLVLDSIIIGLNDADSSDVHKVTVIRNPTSGTIVSGASAASISANRNFDNGKLLDNSTLYKGADGNTFTNGTDYIFAYANENGRTTIPASTVLFRGNSIGIKITPSLSTGTISGYFALVCHLSDL